MQNEDGQNRDNKNKIANITQVRLYIYGIFLNYEWHKIYIIEAFNFHHRPIHFQSLIFTIHDFVQSNASSLDMIIRR